LEDDEVMEHHFMETQTMQIVVGDEKLVEVEI
jgi:hypothetical protein